jgi:ATP-dependent Clp protease ATP-binding subunit ClpC
MLCENCGKREATMHMMCVVQNKKIDKWLCSECARKFTPENIIHNSDADSMRSFIEDILKPFSGDLPEALAAPRTERNQSDRYTVEAGGVLEAARCNAKLRGHNLIGTEHILWALLQMDNCYASTILKRLNLNREIVLAELESWMGERGACVKPEGYTSLAKSALDQAEEAARKDLVHLVSSSHLLLGILAAGESKAARLLQQFDITREKVEELTHQDFIETRVLPENNKFQAQADKEEREAVKKKALASLEGLGRNLSALAAEGKLDPVVGRREEMEHLTQILCRRRKNNPVLIGDAGVGKTAIAEGLAQLIAAGRVPGPLKDKTVFSLELGNVMCGAKYRGELEERVHNLVETVRSCPEIILFIDELQMMMNGGDGMMSIANILKPALARGDLHVIGATTLDDYKKSVEKDAALERRFQPIVVQAPDLKDTLDILRALRPHLHQFHKVFITDETLQEAVRLADQYIADRNQPDKSIDLLDEACSMIKLHPEQTELTPDGEPVVGPEAVAKVASQWTHIPLNRLTAVESRHLLQLETTLHQRVVGQEAAVTALAKAIRRSRAGLKDKHRPIGSFLFLGPTGVGKTELAKTLAENLFGDERALVRFDMSEFMEKHTVSRLIGAPPGYIGYEEGGRLTSIIAHRPYAVILLDEIEKAHPDVFNILLQIMEDGRLTDGQGRTVDFKNTVLIMTSNAGVEKLSGSQALGFAASQAQSDSAAKEAVLDDLKNYFRPEFLNRVDEVLVFDKLNREQLARIVDHMVAELQERLSDLQLKLRMTSAARERLLQEGMDERFGARPLRRALRKYIEDKLADLYLGGIFKRGDTVLIDLVKDDFAFTTIEAEPKPASLVEVGKTLRSTDHG